LSASGARYLGVRSFGGDFIKSTNGTKSVRIAASGVFDRPKTSLDLQDCNMIAPYNQREFVNFFYGVGSSEANATIVFVLMTRAVPVSHRGPSDEFAIIFSTAERLDAAVRSIEPKIFSYSTTISLNLELTDVCACKRSRACKHRATSTFNVGCARGDDL
jgi:hypothetical protein